MTAIAWPSLLAQQARRDSTPAAVPVAGAVHFTTGVSLLHTFGAGPVADGAWAFRVTGAWSLNQALGLEASVLQLGGDTGLVQGGSAGLTWTRRAGPFRVTPSLDLIVGREIVDQGGWYLAGDGGATVYRPFRRPSSTPATGVGVSTKAQWFHRSGLGAELLLGYWHVSSPVKTGGVTLGAGLVWGRRDHEWYWRSSGKDREAPLVTILAPTPDASGVREIGTGGLTVVAADPSGIAGVYLEGKPVATSRAPPAARLLAGLRDPAVLAVIHPLPDAGDQLHLEVSDRAGNRSKQVIQVTPSPSDAGPPQLAVTTPGTSAHVNAPYADVTGVVFSGGPAVRAEVNGCRALAAPAAAWGDAAASNGGLAPVLGHSFALRVPLQPGANPVRVEVTDAQGRRAEAERTIRYTPTSWPPAPEALPTLVAEGSLSASGRAVRLRGFAKDPASPGVLEVRAGDAPAALGFRDAARQTADFLAFVPRTPGVQTAVRATALDGRRSAESRVVVPDSTPAPPQGAALLIGIENYAAAALAGPPGAGAAAKALGDLLRARGAAPVAEEQLRVLTDSAAKAAAIRESMTWLQRAGSRAGVVYVYLAGRVASANGEATAILPYDAADAGDPRAIPWADLDAVFRALPGEVVVMAELAGDDHQAAAPAQDPPCGARALPQGGLAVVVAGGTADGSFSRRVLSALSDSAVVQAQGTVRLSDLIAFLDRSGGESVLRTRGPVFDPALPLTRAPDAR